MTSRGQIQIEVTADTSKVPRQIELQLKAALKGLKIAPVAVDGDTGPFLKKIKQAQDDTERSFRGFMGRLKTRLTGDSQSLGASIGSSLKSGVTSALQSSTKVAGSAAGALGTAIGGAVVAALAPVVIGGISSAVVVGGALAAGAAIIGIGALALKENERLVEEAKSTVDTIKEVFARAAKPLVVPFSEALTEIQKVVKGLEPDLKALFAGMAPSVRALTAALGSTLRPVLDGLKKSLPGINAAFAGLAKALPIIGAAVGKFFETIFKDGPVIQTLTKNLGVFAASLLNILGPAIRGFNVIFSAFVNLGRAAGIGWTIAWEQIKKAFDGGTGAVNRITAAWAPLKQAIMAVWDALTRFAAADTEAELALTMTALVEEIKKAWGPLKDFLGVVWDEAWAYVKRVWNEKVIPWWEGTAKPYLENEIKGFVKRIFSSMVDEAIGYLLGMPRRAAEALAGLGGSIRGAVMNAAAGAGSWLLGAGASIVQGLINGITSRIGSLVATASRLAQSIPSIVRQGLDSHSPSRVMMKVGADTVQGLMVGMSSQEDQMRRQLAGITSSMTMAGTRGARGGDGASMQSPSGVRVWASQPERSQGLGTLVIDSAGSALDEVLVQVLSKAVRVRGGNVQKVLGKSAGGVR